MGSTYFKKIYMGIEKMVIIIENIFLFIAGIILVVMSSLIASDTLLRHFFHSPIIGVLEVTEYIFMVFIVFLVTSYTSRVGGHIKIEFVSKHIPKKFKRYSDILLNIIAIVFVFLISFQAWKKTLNAIEGHQLSSGSVEFIMWPWYLIVVIGTLLLCVRLAIDTIKTTFGNEKGGE